MSTLISTYLCIYLSDRRIIAILGRIFICTFPGILVQTCKHAGRCSYRRGRHPAGSWPVPTRSGNCCIRWAKLQKVRVWILYPDSNSTQVRTTGVGNTHVRRSAAAPEWSIRELFLDEVNNGDGERQSLLSLLPIECLIRQTPRDTVRVAGRDIVEIKSSCPPDCAESTIE